MVLMFSLASVAILGFQVALADDFIPLSSGSFVIVYEQTGEVAAFNFSVREIIDRGCVFTTDADESYFLTSEGNYLNIECFRANRLSGDAVGNNIVAVRLDGVLEHPEGIWASRIINYTLGYNGIEASINNALGPDTQLGPYQGRIATLLGDQLSDMILGFARVPKLPVPEVPFGTLFALLSMAFALVSFVGFKHFRKIVL
jgi:hypothetical protein